MRGNKEDFSEWFDRESGYSLHHKRIPSHRLVQSCCGREPEQSTLDAVVQDKINLKIQKKLYSCPACKRWFFQGKGGYYPAGSLLKYQIIERGKENASD